MMKIQWQGSGLRIIHGYTFKPGQIVEVSDEEIALDILTQPNEPFVKVTEPEPERRSRRNTRKEID
jgi:hypothetical protein